MIDLLAQPFREKKVGAPEQKQKTINIRGPAAIRTALLLVTPSITFSREWHLPRGLSQTVAKGEP